MSRLLRAAIEDGKVKSIQFWYVHNLSESENVRNELRTVQATAVSSLRGLTSRVVDVTARKFNRFNGFREDPTLEETVETVSDLPASIITPLKRGVNENWAL